jgi:hypothetical protein
MPAKKARSAPRPPSGLPEVTVAVRIALLPCREPGKPRISKPVPGSSGESRPIYICHSITPNIGPGPTGQRSKTGRSDGAFS